MTRLKSWTTPPIKAFQLNRRRRKTNVVQLGRAHHARELWLRFAALLVCPGCLTHLIVLRFGNAFLEHLRTLAPAFGIFVFSEGICCLPSGRAGHGIPTLRFGYGFAPLFLR